MKIAVLGYYGQGNTGDDMIQNFFEHAFKAHDLSFFTAWDAIYHEANRINENNLLIIGGGGLIIRNTNEHLMAFKSIQIPFALMGISVQRDSTDNARFLDHLAQKSFFINVRDQYSYDVFCSRRPNCEVHISADLTFHNPLLKTQPLVRSSTIGISIRDWHSFDAEQYSRKYYFKKLLSHHLQKIGIKYPLVKYFDKNDLLRFVEELDEPVCSILMDEKQDITIEGEAIRINSAEDLVQLERCRIIIAMRLHTCIFATQLGIPFIALNYLEKVRRYCEMIDYQYCLELNELKKMPEYFEIIDKNQNKIQNHLSEATIQGKASVESTLQHLAKSAPFRTA